MNTENGQGTLDLSKAETLMCKECDNRLFISSYVIKIISLLKGLLLEK